ncbi:hypothetical protein GCU60_09700 [Blastococcus saxobsidens]|uniref:Uncharacterized protein n=1 Tax=Blastococcus saxobsidens TaxID=138336 RepID=A0A6L9W207_9ACTN|nr:hypothetical protein [Blastococcus saxobsidens]NEK86033.1 hypothetical protein [Blastococcus saxobsidens]
MGSIPTGPTALACTFTYPASLGWWSRPHGAHTHVRGCPRGGVHPVGQRGQVVVEQAGVHVQRHGRRGVPEHPLDALDGRAAGDRERGGGVPQVVRGDVAQPGRPDRRIEDSPTPVPQPQHRAAGRGHQQVVALLARAVAGQGLGEGRGQGHGPPLMGLRCAELQPPADLGDRFGDGESAPEEVDPAHPQGGHLAEAQSGVGEQSDDVPVLIRRVGEPLDLVMGEEPRLLPRHSWQGYALGRVAGNAPVADGEAQEE